MKAAIHNPYLDTLGGGERYTMALAQVAVSKGYRVDVQWEDSAIKNRLERRFNLDLSDVNFIPDIKKGDGYDVCFWVSDGSIPILHARINLLHFQFPFVNVKGKTLLNRMKLFRINKIICNSYFTKRFIDAEFGVKSIVIYPPVAVEEFRSQKKENIILYVGRFSTLTQAKRHDVLIKAFKKFYDGGHNDWELILAGGTEIGAGNYVSRLGKLALGYPVKIIENPTFGQLRQLYGKAKFFWSAAGFGTNEEKEPMRVEHFGITVVEAMASRAIPIIFNAGGYKEIVEDMKAGCLWKKPRELITISELLLNNKRLLKEISSKAYSKSKVYSYESFKDEISKII